MSDGTAAGTGSDPRGETVAVIPARGGSKGVPRKNLRRVGGIPLIARAITSAREAARIDRVVVSTDDREIAAVAREWGAEVVTRPAELSGDAASSESALEHVIDELAKQGVQVGILVFLQATSPFIDPGDLDAAVERVQAGESDSVFSAVESWGFLWRSGTTGAVGRGGTGASGINHDHRRRPRRQERELEFLETGAFYVMDAAGFRRAQHRFFGRIGVALVPETHAIEIDTEEQLVLASAIAPLIGASTRVDVDAVVTDFDGVHTDDTVLILSTETNPVVSARARKLGVEVAQGSADKAAALTAWAAGRGIPLDRIAYLGNDVNDLGCLDLVGWPVAVPEAHPRVLAAARIVLAAPGGDGAVRELAEAVLQSRSSRPLSTRRES